MKKYEREMKISSYFHHIPSYFLHIFFLFLHLLHISSYFLYISPYISFIFPSYFFIIPSYSSYFLHIYSYPRTCSKARARNFSKSRRRGGRRGGIHKIQIYPRVKVFGGGLRKDMKHVKISSFNKNKAPSEARYESSL